MKRFMTTLIASALVAGFALPASAADLPIPTLQKTGQFVLVKHRSGITRRRWQLSAGPGQRAQGGALFFPSFSASRIDADYRIGAFQWRRWLEAQHLRTRIGTVFRSGTVFN